MITAYSEDLDREIFNKFDNGGAGSSSKPAAEEKKRPEASPVGYIPPQAPPCAPAHGGPMHPFSGGDLMKPGRPVDPFPHPFGGSNQVGPNSALFQGRFQPDGNPMIDPTMPGMHPMGMGAPPDPDDMPDWPGMDRGQGLPRPGGPGGPFGGGMGGFGGGFGGGPGFM